MYDDSICGELCGAEKGFKAAREKAKRRGSRIQKQSWTEDNEETDSAKQKSGRLSSSNIRNAVIQHLGLLMMYE
jgi:hypothetical protein